MKRAVPSLLAASVVGLGLAGCADPAETLPVVTPSTLYPSTSSSTPASPRPSGSASAPTLAPPTTSVAPAVHDAKTVAALVKGAVADAKLDLQPAPGGTGTSALLEPCAGAASIKQPVSDTAVTQTWGTLDAAPRKRIVISSVTYRDIAQAAAAVEPLLAAGAACTSVTPVAGQQLVVDKNHRRAVVEGMPVARVDVKRTAGGTVSHDYICLAQVGNVLVQITMTGSDLQQVRDEGSLVLASLARKIQLV